MSELAARHLIQQGAASILVANRTFARAEKIAATIAASIGDRPVTTEILPFEQLYNQAHRADIVITSTGSPDKIFTRAHGRQFLDRRRNRPMLFIDIAVPRDVDTDMKKDEGCYV